MDRYTTLAEGDPDAGLQLLHRHMMQICLHTRRHVAAIRECKVSGRDPKLTFRWACGCRTGIIYEHTCIR